MVNAKVAASTGWNDRGIEEILCSIRAGRDATAVIEKLRELDAFLDVQRVLFIDETLRDALNGS